MIKISKNNIDLENTLLSGQAFRIFKEDNKYIIILSDRVISIEESDNYLVVDSNNSVKLESVVKNYFDLNRDYNILNNNLLTLDTSLESVIEYNKNYKILNQNHFETFISYIISQNNNVKRISKSIEMISRLYGEKVIFNNKEYYLFPTYNQLKNVTEEELKTTGVGFRSKYIINALEFLRENSNILEKLETMSSEEALNKLMEVKGIGLKVASCILLFSYSRFDTFPIDTWAFRGLSDKYKIFNKQEIVNLIKTRYSDLSGLLIQYIYNYERNRK